MLKASQGIVEGLYRNIKRVWQWKDTYGCRQAVKRDQNNSVALQWGATERVPWLLTAARNPGLRWKWGKEHEGKRKDACMRAERERERGGLFGRGGCYLRGAGLAKQESSLLANEFKERSRCHRSERDHLRKLKHPQWKERNELCAVKSAVAISCLSSNRARSLVPPRFLRLSAGSISIGKTCMLYRCW